MGKNVVLNDYTNNFGYYIKISPSSLYDVCYFLKHDPDVKLTLFDQIILIPAQYLWNPDGKDLEILYQLRSLKLPYRVNISIAIADEISIPSIKGLYAGAAFLEQEIANYYGLSLEEHEIWKY